MQKILPHTCPGCQSPLKVKSLVCERCNTEVSGIFAMPLLACLSPREQAFVVDFVKSSGSLKEMAQVLGLSYPTVRNLLDDIIQKLNVIEKENAG